jgi:primosomal protein DnaI
MDSLRDALKAWPGGKEMTDNADRLMHEVMADPGMRHFWSEHPELDNQAIRLNLNKFYQYVKEQRNCTACPGLEACPNDYEGHYTKLECETLNDTVQVVDRKVACSKQIAHISDSRVKSRIRSFYVDDSAMRAGYNLEEMTRLDLKRAGAVGQVLEYIALTKESGLQPKGLYLYGHFGIGKTYLMGYMLNELAKAGHSGVIVYMPEFVEDLKSMLDQPGRVRETVELMKETDLLVFDDIGAENLNPWVRDHVMGTILNYRMNRKPTFYTSNHDLDALERHFSFTNKDGEEAHKGQRLMDRVRPFVERVRVNGDNKRGRT